MNDTWVPERLKNNVYEYARQSAVALGLSPISIEWHEGSPPGKSWFAWVEGHCDLKYFNNYINVIHIDVKNCSTLPLDQLKWTIFHESRHIYQWKNSRHLGPGEQEKDAFEWTDRTLGYFNERGVPYWKNHA